MSDEAPRPGRPWWTYAIPWAGNVPALAQRQWTILGLLCAAEIFDHFDVGLLLLALSQVQQSLTISEEEVGWMVGVIRLGVLPALAITLLADRIGRRRLLLATVLGMTVSTFATGFAQTPTQFIVLQFLVRTFTYAETALAVVVLTEELTERDRGWGIGMLGALGALGHAFAAIAFSFVDVMPYGWRGLYVLGAVPLLFLAWLRRALPETARFEARAERARGEPWWQPAALLMRSYPARMFALGAAVLPLEFVLMAGYTFAPKTLQEVHGFSPGAVGTLYVLGGALGIIGNVLAGQWGDRFGRKRVVAFFTLMILVAFGGFYSLDDAGFLVVPFWIMQVFCLMGIGVTFRALGSELFPTSHRSTASGLRAVFGTLGGVLGLALESLLYPLAGSHGAAILWMLPALLVPPLVIALAIPETAGRALEAISPERHQPPS